MKAEFETALKTSNGVEILASECDNLAEGYRERFDWLRAETGVSRGEYETFLKRLVKWNPTISPFRWCESKEDFEWIGEIEKEERNRFSLLTRQHEFFTDPYFYGVLRCVYLLQHMDWERDIELKHFRTFVLARLFEKWYGNRVSNPGDPTENISEMQLKIAAFFLRLPNFCGQDVVPVSRDEVWRVLDSFPEDYGVPSSDEDAAWWHLQCIKRGWRERRDRA